MTVKGAIFDVDGTLLDSMEIWDTIGSDYLISLGIKPREDLAKNAEQHELAGGCGILQNRIRRQSDG